MKDERKKTLFILILILILALSLRIYKLESVPPAISWDEAAVGVNGWTLANYGKDEYGKIFPLYFRSFGDDKHPIHIYFTAVSVKVLGLNEFSTRFPSAFFGVLNVALIFLLGKLLLKSSLFGLLSAFILAISSYGIHFSRFNHEAQFMLFFFMLGLIFFQLFVKGNNKYLALSALSFAICFITYHPSKVVVPPMILFLLLIYFKKIINAGKSLVITLFLTALFGIFIFLNPQLLGLARVDQTSLGRESVEKTRLFQKTRSHLLGRIELTATQYSWHFMPDFLFIQGDKNPKLSSQTGEFYKVDALFLILGLLFLIFKRSKEGLIIIAWAILAPIPSALVAEAPHAARASLMMGSWHLIIAAGLYLVITFFKKNNFRILTGIVSILILTFFLVGYLDHYFNAYAKRYAIEWQYGMKQIVEYVKEHKEYNQVFMTDARSQPYIFFLYYLKYPLPEYLNSALYNNSESKSYNNVSSFGRFYFGGWDPIESFPNKGVLYILTPYQYDGLRHKLAFDVEKLIKYPNGADAFYIVSSK